MDLNFDSLQEMSLPVRIRGKEYTLREPSGSAHRAHLNCLLRHSSMQGELFTAKEGLADAELVLISECLFEGDQPVGLAFVEKLPVRIIVELNKALKGFQSDPKGSQSSTTAGSGSPTS